MGFVAERKAQNHSFLRIILLMKYSAKWLCARRIRAKIFGGAGSLTVLQLGPHYTMFLVCSNKPPPQLENLHHSLDLIYLSMKCVQCGVCITPGVCEAVPAGPLIDKIYNHLVYNMNTFIREPPPPAATNLSALPGSWFLFTFKVTY